MMDISDVKVHYRRNPKRKNNIYKNGIMPGARRLKSVVKSLLDSGNINDALRIYIRPSGANYHQSEFLEILIDQVVNKARDFLLENEHFNVEPFFCSSCREIIKDPVTPKCGHTFSKMCALSLTKTLVGCMECNEKYSLSYVSELKHNIAILSIVEKVTEKYLNYEVRATASENNINKIYEVCRENILLANVEHPSLFLPTTAKGYFKKGGIFSNSGNLKEAFKAYLTCFTLDSNIDRAKNQAVWVLRKLLENSYYSNNYYSIGNSWISDRLPFDDELDDLDNEETKIDMNFHDRTGLNLMFDSFFDTIRKIGEERNISSKIHASFLDKSDFECPLCMRIFWEPTTTSCGHTFCRACLYRCFDHQPTCPLCKASLTAFMSERVQNTTEFLELAIKNLFPSDYSERRKLYLEEMEQLSNAGIDPEHEIPLFVCTVALPTVPCPLHVFEPRYRLMIRRCMESGSRKFGMCGVDNDEIAEYGTMLKIRNVQYFPDGRSIVDTIGCKRFRILRKGERDGYDTAAVEFLEDQPLSEVDLQSIENRRDRTLNIARVWLMHLPEDTRHQFFEHFGPMPPEEADYISLPDGPSWLWWMLAILPVETRLKVLLVSLTSLAQRFEFMYRILLHFQSDNSS